MAWPPPQASLFADGRLHLHQGPIDLIVEAFGPIGSLSPTINSTGHCTALSFGVSGSS